MYRWLQSKYAEMSKALRVFQYSHLGHRPWKHGYLDYRQNYLLNTLDNRELFLLFETNKALPKGYGWRLDERVVEYPWVLSRLSVQENLLLDAGSTLNNAFLLKLPLMQRKRIVICTLAPEGMVSQANVSYFYGDLRHTILKDGSFDEIVCISTLEHIGLNNSLVYTHNPQHGEYQPYGYREALLEFRRLLAPGGQLFLTVPYGKHKNFGWYQQFDQELLDDAIRVFDGIVRDRAYYRYTPEGWVLSSSNECANCEYFDIRTQPNYDPDYAAAARAVACLQLAYS